MTTEKDKREERLREFLDSLEDSTTASELGSATFKGLDNPKYATSPNFGQHCQKFYDEAECIVSTRFSEWRKRTRRRSASWKDWGERRDYAGGKSVWMLEYLEAVRKLILSWNLRGRTYGQVNRQDKKQFGTVASRLLRHINKIKEDRTKTGTDLIVQAARGFLPKKTGKDWEKKHEPCRLILFENLARYLFKVDRPRRENSRLMSWSHRSILDEAKIQAQTYGMTIETTMAGFSSRYLASSGAPGVRCRYLTADDFEEGLPRQYVVNELEWMLGNTKNKELIDIQNALKEKVQPGVLVPWSGGELFATLRTETTKIGRRSSGKRAHIIHADLNAAQNLQRRFWSRCGEAFRISCKTDTRDGDRSTNWNRSPGYVWQGLYAS